MKKDKTTTRLVVFAINLLNVIWTGLTFLHELTTSNQVMWKLICSGIGFTIFLSFFILYLVAVIRNKDKGIIFRAE